MVSIGRNKDRGRDFVKMYGLKSKMVLTVSLLLTVLLGCMAISGFWYFTAVYKQAVFQQEYLLAENMAREIDNKLDSAHQALILVGKKVAPLVVADAELAQAFLDARIGMNSAFDNGLYLFSPEGKLIAESPYRADRRGQDFSHREYIQTTVKENRPYIGEPYISSQIHHHPAVMFTVPVYDAQGQMIAILGGSMDLLRDNFLGTLTQRKIGQSGYFFLYDTKRTMILHPDTRRILQQDVPWGLNPWFDRMINGFDGTEETVTTRGVSVLSSGKHLQKINWILAVSHPIDEVYAPFIKAKQVVFVAVPLSMLLLLLILWYAMKRMLQPLEELTRHVDTMAGKQGEDRFASHLSHDEVGALGLAFNHMLRELDAKEEKTRRYNRQLTLLHEVSLELMSRRDRDELFTGILQRAAALVGTNHGFVFLLDAAGEFFAQVVGMGVFSSDDGRRVRSTEGLAGKVRTSGELQLVRNYSLWPLAVPTQVMPLLAAMLQAPLKADGEVIGTIGLAFVETDKTFGEEEIQVARQFAELASLAYDNVRLYTAAQQEIQERQKAQNELRQVNDDLERKVGARTMELLALNQELTAMNTEHVMVNRDLTAAIKELQAMQAQLIQSEKMASLGTLVAGVAHEINTPVGVSLTAASHLQILSEEFGQLCRDNGASQQELANYAQDLQEASDIIVKNLERSAKLIRSFKQVSVDQTNESSRTFALRSYLEEILLSVQPLLRKTRLTVEVLCDAELTMYGFPGAFAQIVTNLLVNSLHHAYDGETAGVIRIAVRREDDMLELIFQDDGKGMDEITRSKIFDPFFTTRRGSGGTGLGLYIVYNIVTRQFGGSIECDSAPGQGTKFIIRFPAVLKLHG